ncbi:MAG: hypothetical protein J6M53_02130 [Bacteroidaceae bacterium]|nr:hypothetical protein [Bacteroidaceae bacterium]
MSRLSLPLLYLIIYIASLPATAQTDTLRGHWLCQAEGVHLYLDLGAESLTVPGYEILGPVSGYMRGGMANTWFLTSFKPKGDGAWTLRFSNDVGADTQVAVVQRQSDGTLAFRAVGGVVLRRVVKRKYATLPANLTFAPM